MPYRVSSLISPPKKSSIVFAEWRIGAAGVSARIRPGFSHSFCLRDVAWFRLAYVSTKRGDVGTTSPTVLARRELLTKQSKHRLASLQHHPLIIAQAWKGCSWGHFKKGNATHALEGCGGYRPLRQVRSRSVSTTLRQVA